MSSSVTPSPALRRGGRGALLAAVAFSVAGVVAVVSPWPYPGPEGSWAWAAIETSDLIGEIGVLAALAAVHAAQRRRSGVVGGIGFWLSAAGTVLMAVSTLIWLLPLTDGLLLDVLFTGALLGWLLGLPLVGVGMLRARVLPRWSGWLIVGYAPLFLLAFVLVNTIAAARLPLGLPWLALAAALATLARDDRAATDDVGARV